MPVKCSWTDCAGQQRAPGLAMAVCSLTTASPTLILRCATEHSHFLTTGVSNESFLRRPILRKEMPGRSSLLPPPSTSLPKHRTEKLLTILTIQILLLSQRFRKSTCLLTAEVKPRLKCTL